MTVPPRGIRNNNPGNLIRTGDQWTGLQPPIEQTDRFFKFTDPVYGLRAMAKVLQNYQSIYKLDTVRQVIDRYAPPHENDTASYADHVAAKLDTDIDTPINLTDYKVLKPLMQAIVLHENGVNPYKSKLYQTAIELTAVS